MRIRLAHTPGRYRLQLLGVVDQRAVRIELDVGQGDTRDPERAQARILRFRDLHGLTVHLGLVPDLTFIQAGTLDGDAPATPAEQLLQESVDVEKQEA